MSGGSFDYLYCKGAGDVLASEHLEHMANELEALGFLAKEPAERTRALLALGAQIEATIESLGPVWQAVEWWRSNDWGQDQVFFALGEYRERQKAGKS